MTALSIDLEGDVQKIGETLIRAKVAPFKTNNYGIIDKAILNNANQNLSIYSIE